MEGPRACPARNPHTAGGKSGFLSVVTSFDAIHPFSPPIWRVSPPPLSELRSILFQSLMPAQVLTNAPGCLRPFLLRL